MTRCIEPRILIVDPDRSELMKFKQVFFNTQYQLTLCIGVNEALAEISKNDFQVVISEIDFLRTENNNAFLTVIRKKAPFTRRVLLTASSEQSVYDQAINKANVHAYISKPFNTENLLSVVENQVSLYGKNKQALMQSREAAVLVKETLKLTEKEKRLQKALKTSISSSQLAHKQLEKEHQAVITLIEQIARINRPENEKLLERMIELKSSILDVIPLDAESVDILDRTTHLVFVGQLFSMNRNKPSDPYAFEQAELMLAGTYQLSIVGTILNLSRERFDGAGPLGLSGDDIPELASIFRLLLLWAEGSLVHEDPNALVIWLDEKGQNIVDPLVLQKLIDFIKKDIAKNKLTESVQIVQQFQLLPGMRVTEDIRDNDNLLLIANGTVLTHRLINTLLNYDWFHQIDHRIAVVTDGA